jgi:hypothetical protein
MPAGGKQVRRCGEELFVGADAEERKLGSLELALSLPWMMGHCCCGKPAVTPRSLSHQRVFPGHYCTRPAVRMIISLLVAL